MPPNDLAEAFHHDAVLLHVDLTSCSAAKTPFYWKDELLFPLSVSVVSFVVG